MTAEEHARKLFISYYGEQESNIIAAMEKMPLYQRSVSAFAEAMADARREALEEAAKLASLWSVKPDRSMHPDIPWKNMCEAAQMAAHSTAQGIALEIRAMLDDDSKT